MSLYFMKVNNLTKNKQSAVAKAAYISSDVLYSERDEEYKRYKKRTVEPETFILAPSHAPDWVYDREKLWNEVEKVEKNFNARILKEVVIALPVELNNEDQRSLVEEYVQENFVEKGMVADVAIHRDRENNPHAHILLTVRPFNPDGTWWKTKSRKELIYDENGNPVIGKNGKQRARAIDLTGWNSKENLLLWRKNLAEKINEYYKKKGIDKEVSHLSYDEQGKDKIAKKRLTREEYYVEKRAKEYAEKHGIEYKPATYFGKLNHEIELYNKQIELINQEIISLENYKSNFIPFLFHEFEEIRKRGNTQLTDRDWEAIRFVQKRAKASYVDFPEAKRVMDSLSYWKRKLDRNILELRAEEKMLHKAKDYYEKGSERVLSYGFTIEDFPSQYNEKVEELNQRFYKASRELEEYKGAFDYSKRVYELQKDFLKEEFKYLYPQYEFLAEIDTEETLKIMNDYVQAFKEDEQIFDVIQEIEDRPWLYDEDELLLLDKAQTLIKSYRKQSSQYFKLKKMASVLTEEFKQVLNANKHNLSSSDARNKVYSKAKQYFLVESERRQNEKVYGKTKEDIQMLLLELYGDHQKDVIGKLPDRVKVRLLEKFIENGDIQDLEKDLKTIQFELRHGNSNSRTSNGLEDEMPSFSEEKSIQTQDTDSNSTVRPIGSILEGLIQQAKANEMEEPNKRKRKRKGRRLTKEEKRQMERGDM